MRLAFLGWANHVHLQRWAGYFAQQGEDVRVLSMSDSPARINGMRCPRLWTRDRGPRWKAREIRMRLWPRRPDVLHAHWASFGYLAQLSGLRPYGITVWGSDIYTLDQYEETDRNQCVQALREAAFVTCDSDDLRRRLLAIGVPDERVAIVQWGVDADMFRPDRDVRALRAQLSLDDGAVVVFSPRQLGSVYRIDVVLDAFQRLLQQRPEIVLVQKYYISDAAEVEQWMARAREVGIPDTRIRWVGRLEYEDMAALYALAAFVVSVPASDGMPVSLLEAMAAGRPVVVSGLPSVLEWVEPGQNGLVVPVDDAGALRTAMITLLERPQLMQDMGVENRRQVLERGSQRYHMSRMLEIYRGALTG